MAESSNLSTYWLTRDMDADGELSELIDVWLARPSMMRTEDGKCVWVGPGATGLEEHYAQWSVAVTMQHCRVIPETYRECIRVNGDD